jgi:hypothetical protein
MYLLVALLDFVLLAGVVLCDLSGFEEFKARYKKVKDATVL